MKKRIFISIFLASFISVVLTILCVIRIMYTSTMDELKQEIRTETSYLAAALEEEQNGKGQEMLSSVGKTSDNRITLISNDGTVIYDNYAKPETMENHAKRPEFIQAAESGIGEELRYSGTIGKQTYYYASKLKDGTILRLASTTVSVYGLLGNGLLWILNISVVVLVIALIIAHFLTNKIIKPLNTLNLESPLTNATYEELSPLLNRMEKQNRRIRTQMVKLAEQKNEFEYITAKMKEGLVILNEEGNILTANASAGKIFGNSRAGSYIELCRDEYYLDAVSKALKGEAASEKLYRNGKVYQLLASSVEAKETSYSVVLFIVDITDSETAEEMRREFTANVSHELKTPLTSIMGCAEIIANGISKPEDVPGFATQIHSEAQRLLKLIEDIIKLSRLDEGKLKTEFEDVELSNLAKEVMEKLSIKAKEKDINVSFVGEKAIVKGYKTVLYEMLYNLYDNAINYNMTGGSIDVAVSLKGEDTVFTIKDTGIGIAPEHIGRIFERFYRVDKSHSKETGGTGLGLSIVKHGASLHNAQVEIESTVGEGTKISVTFPKKSLSAPANLRKKHEHWK